MQDECGVTALWCRNKVKSIFTRNAMGCVELRQKEESNQYIGTAMQRNATQRN